MGDRNDIDSSWLTLDGQVISPDAPAGGGGAGSFRVTAGTLGTDDPVVPARPSPDSPAARYVDPAIPLDAGDTPEQKVNPPPTTATGTESVLQTSDELNDIKVDVEVLADKVDTTLGGGGDTDFNAEKVRAVFPGFKKSDDGKSIAKFLAKFSFKGKFFIQVLFQSATEKTELSAYGRGTTADDVKNGNVTVGFHESCHVADYKDFIKNHPLPTPTLTVGMSIDEYTAEQASFTSAYDKWKADILAFSEARTDQTGKPTKAQWEAKNATK